MSELFGYKPQEEFETPQARADLAKAWREGPGVVDTIGGVRTIIPYTQRPADEDCIGYVLGTNKDAIAVTRKIRNEWDAGDVPLPGAIAIYLSDDTPFHMGVVGDDGLVISKWTTRFFESGNVYQHLPFAVPDDYGNRLLFYTPK